MNQKPHIESKRFTKLENTEVPRILNVLKTEFTAITIYLQDHPEISDSDWVNCRRRQIDIAMAYQTLGYQFTETDWYADTIEEFAKGLSTKN